MAGKGLRGLERKRERNSMKVKLQEKQFWAWRESKGQKRAHCIEWNDGKETHLLVVTLHGVMALKKLLAGNGYEDISWHYHNNYNEENKTPSWTKDSNGREKGPDHDAYNRDLKLRVLNGQLGSGMNYRP